MSGPVLQIEPIRPGIEALVLNRPERRNALTIALMKEICETIERLSAGPDCRVLLLRGAGPVFCAGLDLREASDTSTADEGPEWVARMFSCVQSTPLVTICEAQGAAMAGGAGLLAACDFSVASDDLRIGFPEVRRGLVPALVSTILRHKLRDADLRELFLLAEPVDAQKALSMGLVHRIVPPDQVRNEALRLAELVLQAAPQAVRDTKRLIADLNTSSELDAVRIAHQYHRDARVGDEAREGLAAFLEKRPPRWA